MLYGIIGLVFILLIVFSVLSAKDWHWVNIVFLILTYLAGVAATLGLAQVFHERNKVMKNYTSKIDDALKFESQARTAIYGAPDSVEYDSASLQGANQLLNLAMLGRGRIWSGGTVTIEDPVRVFTFDSPLPEVENENQSLEDVELFAFLETTLADGQVYPVSFIGKVRVTEQSPEALRIEDVFISNPREFVAPTGKWALFEKMPIDRHGVFRDVEKISEDDFDISNFRQLLMTKYMPAQGLGFDPQSEEYERLIDRFTFDGLPLGKIDTWVEQNQAGRKSDRFEPFPEEVRVQYEFKKKSRKEGGYAVDFDGNLDTDGPFTPLGLAVDPTLHAGKAIEFAAGDTIMVDQLTAEGYQRSDDTKVPPFAETEDVEEKGRFFVRQLNDYPFLLADLQNRTERLDRETVRLQDNNAVQDKALTDTQNQVKERTRVKLAYDQDNENLQNDIDSINALENKKQQEVQDNVALAENLQQQIEDLRRQLESQSQALINSQ